LQQVTRLGARYIETRDAIRGHFECCAFGQVDHVEEPLMITLGHARADHHVFVLRHLGDGEIPGNTAPD
jgi:hypothetical protein